MADTHVRFDWAMKHILRDKANFGILEGFLYELLKEEVKIQEILESEGNQADENDKFNRVNLLVKDSRGRLIIVEVQTRAEIDYFLRMLYGVSKAITEFMGRGDEYKEVKKVISISLAYVDIGQGEDYVYVGETDFVGLHRRDHLQLSSRQRDFFQSLTPRDLFPTYYIINVHKFQQPIRDGLDEWIYFFHNSKIASSSNARGLSEAAEKLRVANLNEAERRAYDREMRRLSDKASQALTEWWETEGWVKKAKELEKIEIAKKSIRQGLKNEVIAAITELSIDEIEKLRAELNF